MRLRNIPRADDTLQAHFTVIKNPKEFRGNWTSVFRKRPSDTDRDRNGKRTLLIKYGKNLS